MSGSPHPAGAALALILAGSAWACAPDHAPPPPDRQALQEREARLEEVAARLEEISGATVSACLVHAGHPDPRVRRAAVLRLMELGEPARSTVPDLVALLADDESPRVRAAAARALGALADERAVDPLVAALVDEDVSVRLFAWKALRRLGETAHARLVFHLGPDSPVAGLSRVSNQGPRLTVRNELRNLLPRLGKPFVPHLVAALEGGEENRTVNALRVLWQIGPDAAQAVPALVKLVETGNQELRFQATRALGAIGDVDQAVLPALRRASKDETDQVRRTAERALKDISDAARKKGGKKPPRRGAGGPEAGDAEPVKHLSDDPVGGPDAPQGDTPDDAGPTN